MARRSAKTPDKVAVFDPRPLGANCDACPLQKSCKPVQPHTQQYPGSGKLVVIQGCPNTYESSKGQILDTASNRLLDQTLTKVAAGTVTRTYACLCSTAGCTPEERDQAVACCRPRLQRELETTKDTWQLLLGYEAWKSVAATSHPGKSGDWYGSPLQVGGSHAIATWSPAELVLLAGRRHTGYWYAHVARAVMLADGRMATFSWPKETIEVGGCKEALQRVLVAAQTGQSWGFDLEADGLGTDARISCIAFSTTEESVCVQMPPTPEEDALMRAIMVTPGMVGQNVGYYDRPLLQHQGWALHTEFYDTMFAASVLDPQQDKDLHNLVSAEFSAEAWKAAFRTDVNTGTLKGDIWGSTDPEVASERRLYCGRDSYTTLQVSFAQRKRLAEYGQRFLDDIMFQYGISMEMRREGVKWNKEAATRLDQEWSQKRAVALQAIHEKTQGILEKPLNPGSPQQLKEFFFTKCGLVPTHRTPKGEPSTGYDALMAIRKQGNNKFAAVLAGLVLDFRDADKMLGTYIRGMAPKPGETRVYGAWKVHATVSGRWGCSKL